MMWLLACLPLLGSPDLSYKGYRVVYSGSVKKELENGFEVRLEFQRNIIFGFMILSS